MGNEQSASSSSSHSTAAMHLHPMLMVTPKTSSSSRHRSDGKKKTRKIGSSSGGNREHPHQHRQSLTASSLSSLSSSQVSSVSAGSLSLDLSMLSRRGSVELPRKASIESALSISLHSSEGLGRRESARDVTLFEDDAAPDDRKRALRLKPIPNRYESIDQVQRDLKIMGLETSKLVIAIDYTKSNRLCGEKTFGGRNLHDIDPTSSSFNLYESVISTIGRVLEIFSPSPDAAIPVFGFGDTTTKSDGCFPLFPAESAGCSSLDEVMQRYREVTPSVKLLGPRSFAPAIRATIDVVKRQPTLRHHVLVLVTCGVPASEEETRAAVAAASTWPISIVVVGVGDGPWDALEAVEGDTCRAKTAAASNFQFVDFFSTTQRNARGPEAGLAYAALARIPDQAKAAQRLNRTASAF